MPDNWDGLVRVKPKRMDAAYVAPGTDFRAYTKVMFDPAEVAFKKDWHARRQRRVAGRIEGRDGRGCPEDPRGGARRPRPGLQGDLREGRHPGGDRHRRRTCCVCRPAWPISTSTRRTRCRPAGRGPIRPKPARRRWCSRCATRRRGALLGRVFDRRETRQSGRSAVDNQRLEPGRFLAAVQELGEHLRQGVRGAQGTARRCRPTCSPTRSSDRLQQQRARPFPYRACMRSSTNAPRSIGGAPGWCSRMCAT